MCIDTTVTQCAFSKQTVADAGVDYKCADKPVGASGPLLRRSRRRGVTRAVRVVAWPGKRRAATRKRQQSAAATMRGGGDCGEERRRKRKHKHMSQARAWRKMKGSKARVNSTSTKVRGRRRRPHRVILEVMREIAQSRRESYGGKKERRGEKGTNSRARKLHTVRALPTGNSAVHAPAEHGMQVLTGNVNAGHVQRRNIDSSFPALDICPISIFGQDHCSQVNCLQTTSSTVLHSVTPLSTDRAPEVTESYRRGVGERRGLQKKMVMSALLMRLVAEVAEAKKN